jgi:release factor glutamine methyltransferase
MDRDAIVRRLRSAGCVFAEDEAELLASEATTAAELDAMVDRRVGGEPLEYVLGWAEFAGRRVTVEPGVFVPRHRTEFLVDQAVALARSTVARNAAGGTVDSTAVDGTAAEGTGVVRTPVGGVAVGLPPVPAGVVVDLCCGSGAIGLAVAAALSGDGIEVELHATDIEPSAVCCARRNVAGVGGQVYEGDLFEPLPPSLRGRVHVLTANVPYVPTDAIDLMPPEARDHEARITLDGGADGLDVLRRVAARATQWLVPGGHLLVETSERQASVAANIMTDRGLAASVVTSNEAECTILIGTS